MAEIEERRARGKKIIDEDRRKGREASLRIAEHLKLDPKQITEAGLRVSLDGASSVVEIRWDGIAVMPVSDFQKLMEGL